jgi:diguanylate cyclase (GGDEF)-like protein/PAS domain S-box-containing protein/hemerythrin-like metal-binding protein
MDITEMFFDESLSPKLIYTFEPGSDIENTEYRCERMNPAAERWIRENADGADKSLRVETVFEAWGVLADYRKILATARRDGICFSALFAHVHDYYVVLDAFAIGDHFVGLMIRRYEDVKRAFPLDIFLSISLDILCIADENGKFVRVNSEFSKLLGYEIADVEGMQVIDLVHPEDMPPTLEAIRRLSEGEPVPYFINRYRTKSGEYRYLQWKSMPFPPYIIASARDITEAFSLSLSLEKEFTSDSLTGVANRKFFEHEARRLVDNFSKNAVLSSLLMVDLDHFKRVNDTYGHPVGDTVLISLVKILVTNCRTTDTVARVGGEEFAVLLPGSGSANAFTIAEKMREAVEAFDFEGVGYVTASFGVAELFAEDDLQRWYTRADTALYLAKNNGRNRTVTSDMLYHSDERIEVIPWENELESGNPLIDKEHRDLLLAGEKLLIAYYDDEPEEEARRLKKLFQLLSDHFTHEEQILEDAGYLDLVSHREIHRALLSSATFWRTLQSKERVRTGSFYGFLINKVIRDHLINEDAKFFPMFRKNAKG